MFIFVLQYVNICSIKIYIYRYIVWMGTHRIKKGPNQEYVFTCIHIYVSSMYTFMCQVDQTHLS